MRSTLFTLLFAAQTFITATAQTPPPINPWDRLKAGFCAGLPDKDGYYTNVPCAPNFFITTESTDIQNNGTVVIYNVLMDAAIDPKDGDCFVMHIGTLHSLEPIGCGTSAKKGEPPKPPKAPPTLEWSAKISTRYALYANHRYVGSVVITNGPEYEALVNDVNASTTWNDLDAAKEEVKRVFLEKVWDKPARASR